MVGCSQAELSMEFQTDVLKGEEYRSGCIIFRQDRGPYKCGGGGGGIGIVVYIRNSFRASIIHNLSTVTDANSQQLWLKVQCRKSKSFLLCAAYRPDSVSMSRFLDDFTSSFMDSLLQGMEVTVTCNLMQTLCRAPLVLRAYL